jgi:transcriptional regulator with XRE-family HTH domain
MTADIGARIERARVAACLSQRALADATGISQSTLSRVISGQRAAKVPELAAIGWTTGVTMAELAGTGTVAERAEGAARATNHADMDGMREALLHFLELDDYLFGQAIPAIVLPGAEHWLPKRKAACQLRSSAVIIISECSR